MSGNGDNAQDSSDSASVSDNRYNANPTLEWGRVQAPAINPGPPLKRESNLPVSALKLEPMVVEETAPASQTSMPKETPEIENLASKPAKDPSREEEVVKDTESTQTPDQAISQPESQTHQLSQTPVPESKKQDESIPTAAESKGQETTAQVVPVVEVPTAAIETQAQAQTVHTGGDPSPEVGAGVVADADSSASPAAPVNN